MVDKVEKIWIDGAFVNWDDAKVHVLTHTLHYGLGRLRGHPLLQAAERQERHLPAAGARRAAVRLGAHLHHEARADPGSRSFEACLETVRVNKLEECYLRPLAFLGSGAMGLGATENRTHLTIVAWKWGAYLGDEGLKQGHPRQGQLVCAPERQLGDGQGQGGRPLRQLNPGQARGDGGGLPGGHHARRRRATCARPPARTSSS